MLLKVVFRRVGPPRTAARKTSGPRTPKGGNSFVLLPSQVRITNRSNDRVSASWAGRPASDRLTVWLLNSPRKRRAPTGVTEVIGLDHSGPTAPSKSLA